MPFVVKSFCLRRAKEKIVLYFQQAVYAGRVCGTARKNHPPYGRNALYRFKREDISLRRIFPSGIFSVFLSRNNCAGLFPRDQGGGERKRIHLARYRATSIRS